MSQEAVTGKEAAHGLAAERGNRAETSLKLHWYEKLIIQFPPARCSIALKDENASIAQLPFWEWNISLE